MANMKPILFICRVCLSANVTILYVLFHFLEKARKRLFSQIDICCKSFLITHLLTCMTRASCPLIFVKPTEKMIMLAYGFNLKMTESEYVAELFKLYEKLSKGD